MKEYVRVYDNIVQEFFSTDGDITTMFHPDMIWVEITNIDPRPEQGWSAVLDKKAGWVFAKPVVLPPTVEELTREAMATRSLLIQQANLATAGMADAYIADLLDEAEVTMFKAFAKYKLLLNKIDQQSGFPQSINWPTYPTV